MVLRSCWLTVLKYLSEAAQRPMRRLTRPVAERGWLAALKAAASFANEELNTALDEDVDVQYLLCTALTRDHDNPKMANG